jgi:hypothetical protein
MTNTPNNLELKIITNKEDMQKITNKDKWFEYQGNNHKVIGCNEDMITTVSQEDGFIINTTYDRNDFPKILHQEKTDMAYFLREIGGENKLKENSVWYSLGDEDKRTFWNMNFYKGRY